MKKNIFQFACMLLVMTIMVSCEQDELPAVQETQPLSEIASLEKQLNVTFYKKDLTLTDEAGKNTVTIRIASLNENLLNEYLRVNKYSIKLIRKGDPAPSRAVTNSPLINPSDTQITDEDEIVGYDSKIITEEVSTSFADNIIGYQTQVKNSLSPNEAGRTKTRVWVEHTSQTWPEELHMYNDTYDYMHYKVYRKKTTLDCCWGSYWKIGQFTSFHEFVDIDGPYRVMVKIEYDNAFGGVYDYNWVNDGTSYK